VTITCDTDILEVDGDDYAGGSSLDWVLGDGESVELMVDTYLGDSECWATEDIVQSGVEAEASPGCAGETLTANGSGSCVFTNTVFFEGIPTLSQYGMALGFVGFRRFV
jgi:hypothetical protein